MSNLEAAIEQIGHERAKLVRRMEALDKIEAAYREAKILCDEAPSNGEKANGNGAAMVTNSEEASIADRVREALKGGPLFIGEIRKKLGLTHRQVNNIHVMAKEGRLKVKKTVSGKLFSLCQGAPRQGTRR